MRPRRLELEGFTAFRDRTVVDFAGADLFAFTGPTGSGKTSLVDAMTFALFGCVPRFDDRRLVAPVISQNANEARVRLDFDIGGATYTAVRVVRRTKTGATTKEARLEDAAGTVLAGNERELGEAVERLLGLSYEHFVKCVVLPQGEFARFLHDKPERRQELLVDLLDLGAYDRMAQAARRRADAARTQIEVADARLADLAFATIDARKEAEARVDALTELRDHVDEATERLAALTAEAAEAHAAAEHANAAATLLGAVRVPRGIADLADEVARAEQALAAAAGAEHAAAAATETAEAALLGLPARAALERAATDHERRIALLANREKGTPLLADRDATLATLTAVAEAAAAAATQAEAGVHVAEAGHRAAAVVGDLVAGEPCPVCQQTVGALPATGEPPDLGAAKAARKRAEADLERARRDVAELERDRMKIEEKLRSIDQQLAEVDVVLADHPDPAAVEVALTTLAAAEGAVESARSAERTARKRRVDAESAAKQIAGRVAAANAEVDAARDALAPYNPPPRRRGDLADEWQALAAWAESAATDAGATAAEASTRAAGVDHRRREALTALAERCAALDVVIAGHPTARDAVVDALAVATAACARIADALADAEAIQAERERHDETRQVAELMGRLLGARGFEKWMLDEAVEMLVDGATDLLLELSGGQYSLALDARSGNFAVLDHRNADEARPARTLSGGETFLASLALALAPSDRIALLAASGAARLESIFLDEGFGTLDADTLDVVATAIEELGARGRMVGLISHVAELAERVPVRFEVTKVANASTVTRVDR